MASEHHVDSLRFWFTGLSILATASLAGLPSEGTTEVMYLIMSYILIGSQEGLKQNVGKHETNI